MRAGTLMRKITARIFAAAVCFVAAISVVFCFTPAKKTASAATVDDPMAAFVVEKYDADVTVNKDRTVDFHERITVRFTEYLPASATTYYRSLPVNGGDRYFDISAKCGGNGAFSYKVADNPDIDGFIDINCKGGVRSGNQWTYEFFYTMLPERSYGKDGMILDVVGFGSSVAMHNVDVTVRLPAAYEYAEVYSNGFGKKGNAYVDGSWAQGGAKTVVSLHADKLPLKYNAEYRETMSVGITFAFKLPKGVLQSYSSTRITGSVWAVLGMGALVIAAAIAITLYCRRQKEIVRVVNIKAPQQIDPLRMGKLIDGTVDNEDITSMIYWFAAKGYLVIDMTVEEDPIFRKNNEIPDSAPSYQKALFNGLFKRGNEVHASQLSNRYYTSIDSAKKLLTAKDVARYEKRSWIGMIVCCLLALAYWVFCPLLIGLNVVGGGYLHWGMGLFTFAPVAAIGFLLKIWKDKKYKNKKSKNLGWLLAAVAVGAVAMLAYLFIFRVHVISRTEQILVCLISLALCFFSVRNLSLTEKFAEILGDILGFKDFIVYTEEDKIKIMLEENPELYYDVLPYAQVLGVTDAWEDKFERITIARPSWAVGNFTVFDYFILRSVMRSATLSMLTRPQNKTGGTHIGRSGGGGGFGGFSGGGSGGGGMGVR